MSELTHEPDDDDVVWGAERIAAVIHREIRATHHLLGKGELPARKVGGRWVASKRRLREFLTGETVTSA